MIDFENDELDYEESMKRETRDRFDYAFKVIQRNAKANPRKQFGMRENQDCKECDGSMRIRTNNFTGELFLGCSNFPECRFADSLMPSEKNRMALEHNVEEKSFYKF